MVPLTQRGMSALHMAAERGHLDMVKFLISTKVDINLKADSEWKKTPLHYAAENGKEDIVEFLLKCDGINAKVIDLKTNLTAYELAVERYRWNVVKVFHSVYFPEK